MAKNEKSDLSRRKFLGSTAVVAAAAVAGDQLLFPKGVEAVRTPAKWDREADVVVVGTGYSGFTAALEAFDAGSKVILIEKAATVGGNSIIANGNYNAVDPERQKKQGIQDSTDLFYAQTLAYGDYFADPEKLRFLVDNAFSGLQWLEKMGVEFNPTVVGMPPTLRTHPPAKNGRGAAIVSALKAQAEKRKIPVLLEYKLTGIVREKPLTGAVQGIEVEHRGKKLYIKAKKATVLATGGFSADVKLRSKYVPRLDADVLTTNNPGATGEAILAAQDEGADVVDMEFIETPFPCNPKTRKMGSVVNAGKDSAVFVNIKGERFVAEDAKQGDLNNALLQQPKRFLLWVADDRCAKAGNEAATADLLKQNLCFKGDTLEDLAKVLKEQFDVPPYKFLATVKQYNEFAAKGEDKQFRKAAAALKALEKGPFYASPAQVGVQHTMGGLRTKGSTAQVVDRSGNPISRLYAAGEVSGGTHGDNRIGGNGTAAAIVFGRLSGQKAAAEKPWG
jgi:urocanate reductase